MPTALTRCLSLLCAMLVILCTLNRTLAQSLQTASNYDRERGRQILSAIKEDLKKNYYDPAFHGVNIDAEFKTADERIKQATTNGQIFRIIAALLLKLNDSHTFFIAPSRAAQTDYGWQMQMIGDKPFIVAVKPGSDAEAKGVKVGDQIYSLDGYQPTRENLWQMKYLYYSLEPRSAVKFVLQDESGRQRELLVQSRVKQGVIVKDLTGNGIWDVMREAETEAHLKRHRFVELGDELVIWKMPEFDLERGKVDDIINKVRKHQALILDLRGNHGGSEETLLRLIGNLFDHDVQVGEIKRRKENKPLVAKTRGKDLFTGKLVVLVDSESGSAAELLARVVQLEKRGTVLGDRTAGAVMRSRVYDHQTGIDTVSFYAASVTDADIRMSDGQSLEKVGVTPDELILPTQADLFAQRDPVLARAAEIVGVKLDAAKAGTFFPIEWKK